MSPTEVITTVCKLGYHSDCAGFDAVPIIDERVLLADCDCFCHSLDARGEVTSPT